MANAYFEVDTGVNVGGVSISATTNDITTTGNIVFSTSQISYNANSVPPKSYVDNIAVVFGI